MSHVLYLLSLAIHEPINYDFMAFYSEKVDNLPQVTQPADGKARILTESAHSLSGSTPSARHIVQRVPRCEGVRGSKIGALLIGQLTAPISVAWFLHLFCKNLDQSGFQKGAS